MYLYQTFNGTQAREFCEEKLTNDSEKWDLSAIKKVEIYSNDSRDGGEDFCEIRVIDHTDSVIAVRRVFGY